MRILARYFRLVGLTVYAIRQSECAKDQFHVIISEFQRVSLLFLHCHFLL